MKNVVKTIFTKEKVILTILILLIMSLWLWQEASEKAVVIVPKERKADLNIYIEKENLTEADYTVLTEQTGLSGKELKHMSQKKHLGELSAFQDNLYEPYEVSCENFAPFVHEERLAGTVTRKLCDLKEGDILVTNCAHFLGYRNGHAALVVNAKDAQTLEAVVLGSPSAVQAIYKWEKYPVFVVLRLKGITEEERQQIVQYAMANLDGVKYSLTVGLTGSKDTDEKTHCAHLIWQAYKQAGYDLDSNGGRIVLPKDIAASSYLEVVQNCGMDVEKR